MANSKITIIFNSAPSVGEFVGFSDTSRSLDFYELFRWLRLGSNQVKAPAYLNEQRYEATYVTLTDTSNIGITYSKQGNSQFTLIDNLVNVNNMNGTTTAIIECDGAPTVVYADTRLPIPSSPIVFNHVRDVYTNDLIPSFINAFTLDYNLSNLYTVNYENAKGSNYGKIIITANYEGAVFQEEQTTADVTYEIDNVIDDPFVLIDSDIGQDSENPCSKFLISLETSKEVNIFLVNNVRFTSYDTEGSIGSNLVRSYNFDEVSGSSLIDSVSTRNGSLINGAENNQPGLIGRAVRLNYNGVTNQSIDFANHEDIRFGSGAFSFEIWVRPDQNYGTILSKFNNITGVGEYALTYQSNTLVFTILTDASNKIEVADNVHMQSASWNQIVISYDGSGNESGLKMFVNNNESSYPASEAGNFTGMPSTNEILRIGGPNGGTEANRFSGLMDIFRIWKGSAINADDVSYLFNNGSGVESLPTSSIYKYTLSLYRGTAYSIRLRNTEEGRSGGRGGRGFDEVKYLNGLPFTVPKLIASYFDVRVNVTSAGAIVTVNSSLPQSALSLDLEYSLDGVDWSTSNVFSGLSHGDYTMYIRDSHQPSAMNLGCQIEIPFTIDEIGTRKPYVNISKANSINYSLVERIDNCNVFRNDENSLSHQSLARIRYCDEILLTKCDNPITQIHSNYRDVNAILRNENGETVFDLNVVKKTSNLNRYQSMDAMIFSYQPGVSAIYFDSGNTYDEFGAVNGSYNLSGNLPDMAKIGSIIDLQNLGTFEVIDETFDFEKNKKTILINHTTASTLPEPTVVSSLYDLLNFEVYEFEMNCALLHSGIYDIVITNSNGDSNDKIFVSENIYVEDNHSDTLHILYFGKNNRDIFYKYGIKNMIRFRYENVVMNILDEIETITTDDNTGIVKSTVKDGNTFIFDEVPRDFAFKLILALSMEYVFINGSGYAKANEIEYEVIDNTNMYKVTANMIKTNIMYTTIGQQEEFVDMDTGIPIAFPRIITDGTNFIKA